MNKKDMLLEYLKKQDGKHFISAKILGDSLGVTDRTIRNYVKLLNDEQPALIESSREGYRLSGTPPKVIKESGSGSHIDTRRFYILRRLIKSSDRGLDLYDLADALYVSDATIRSDIANLNRLVTKHELKIIQKDTRYILKGEEKLRRKLMIELINDSKPAKGFLEEEIQIFLGDISLQDLRKLSKNNFERYSILPNSYFFKNFILHLAIAVARAVDNGQLEQSSYTINNRNSKSLNVVRGIASDLYNQHKIILSEADKDELAILFNGQLKDEKIFIDDCINTNISKALEHAIQEISDVYMIDFNNENFKTRLLVHIQNLFNRLALNKHARNLNVLNIRVNYPVIFDIAVYLASVLSNDLDIKINDDEIAFIALHIGSYLNSKTSEDNDTKTVIITPNYLSQQSDIQKFIQEEFGDDLFIVGIYEDAGDISSIPAPELIITTESMEQFTNDFVGTDIEIVSIRKFTTKHDATLIRRATEKVKHKKFLSFLQEKIPELIRNDFLVNIHDNSSKAQIMRVIADGFQQKGYVNEDYLNKLNERERVSSTAFPSGVAIPHTMKYEANKTGLMILKPEKQVIWDRNEVKLIIGIAVNKEDSHMFNLIFPRIIELVAEPYNVNYLVEADTRKEFIDRLIDLIAEGDYFPG
ncbi:BglG family transcription antiterminator [Virgibacillus natechei]